MINNVGVINIDATGSGSSDLTSQLDSQNAITSSQNTALVTTNTNSAANSIDASGNVIQESYSQQVPSANSNNQNWFDKSIAWVKENPITATIIALASVATITGIVIYSNKSKKGKRAVHKKIAQKTVSGVKRKPAKKSKVKIIKIG